MWVKWLPWRYMVSRAARAGGFIDPLSVMARLERFAQPSEVGEPIELLRAGLIFHARGLVNRAIQHNLDWVWPYWVERQFDPEDESFMPRAFSVTHVNLTHRNWTAVGLPDVDALPIVDPRGLVTPVLDGWSLDGWVVAADGTALFPSQVKEARQHLEYPAVEGVAVVTRSAVPGLTLESRVFATQTAAGPVCRIRLTATSDREASLVVSLRPYNPEGVAFVHEVALEDGGTVWSVDDFRLKLSGRPDRTTLSTYHRGDVKARLAKPDERTTVTDEVGMATAAALYVIPAGGRTIEVDVPLVDPETAGKTTPTWPDALAGLTRLSVTDSRTQNLFDAALRSLVLHSPADCYPGPYTYKRFWFRDAAFIVAGLLAANLVARAERVIRRFPQRQTRDGYFLSQEGEWDSNGEALWIMHRFCELTGRAVRPEWLDPIRRAGIWIENKRLPDTLDAPHAGLLPAGFSAEHLGPNDYYYWDDFWAIAGLRAGAAMLGSGDARLADRFRRTAESLVKAVERSLAMTAAERHEPGIPASPYRRIDAGAVGSLAASYPLQLWPARESRLISTIDAFHRICWVKGGFFQDMIHSGINPYLTLHVAQVLLRAGDARFADALRSTAALATTTGQWPEAIHPRTLGGCMGDGQHVWAAAEWVLMIRNCFVREEDGELILAAGILPEWVEGRPATLGPTPTPFGDISIHVEATKDEWVVSWDGAWRGEAPAILVAPPGCEPERAPHGVRRHTVARRGATRREAQS